MQQFRKIWNEVTNGWIINNSDLTKTRRENYESFILAFPDSDVTFTAYANQCSRLGIVRAHAVHGSTKIRPLYSEQVKKGYVRIKVAQPNVWISKAQWIYEETNPGYITPPKTRFIFLNGDTRDFSPDNIYPIPLKLCGIFSHCGGVVPGAPELTRLNIMRAHLFSKRLDVLEEHGQVYRMGHYRVAKQDYNESMKRYRQSEGYRKSCEKQKQRLKEKRAWIKDNAPLEYERILEKNRENHRRRKARKMSV